MEPQQQRRDSQAAVTLSQRRAAKGVSISVGEAAEGSSSIRRTFLEGEKTLASPSSEHWSNHNKQQQQ